MIQRNQVGRRVKTPERRSNLRSGEGGLGALTSPLSGLKGGDASSSSACLSREVKGVTGPTCFPASSQPLTRVRRGPEVSWQ